MMPVATGIINFNNSIWIEESQMKVVPGLLDVEGENINQPNAGVENKQPEVNQVNPDGNSQSSRLDQDFDFADGGRGMRYGGRPISNNIEPESAPSSGSVLRRLIMGSRNKKSLSHEGQHFLDTIRENLGNTGVNIIDTPVDGTYLATNGTSSICCVFSETQRSPVQDNEFVPMCAILDRIAMDPMFTDTLRKNHLSVDSMVLIHPSDYTDESANGAMSNNIGTVIGKASANCIKNTLMLSTGADLTIGDLASYPIRINTNQPEVRRYFEDNCSSSVVPHYQTGIAIEICLDGFGGNRGYRRGDDADRGNWEFLAAIGVTTEFIDTSAEGEYRFIPIVSITACESIIRSIKMMPLLVGVAMEMFISQRMYLDPFRNWGEGNPAPNLGSLIFDEQDKLPTQLLTRDDYEKFVNRILDYPVLAVDVRYGAWNLPAFDILMSGDIDLFREEMYNLCPDIEVPNPVLSSFNFYSGFVRDNNVLMDTRAIDYFRVVDRLQDPELLAAFKEYTTNPEDRIRAIAEAGWRNGSVNSGTTRGNYNVLESLYDTHRFILSSDAVVAMLTLLNELNITKNIKATSGLAFDLGSIRDLSRRYRSCESAFTGGRNVRRGVGYGNFNRGYRY